MTAPRLNLGLRPAFGEGDAQFLPACQLCGIGYQMPLFVLHQAVAARQHLSRVEQFQLVRGIFHAHRTLHLQGGHRLGEPFRPVNVALLQAHKIAARTAQPLHHSLTAPLLLLQTMGYVALQALLQLRQLLRLAL